jgi:hypothetical protein
MKKLLIVGTLILLVSGAYADPPPQGYSATGTKKRDNRLLKPPPVSNRTEMGGVLPRAFSAGGNPLQMLNPRAPAQYGTAAQAVSIDPDTGKWNGIKLFEIFF